VTAYFLFFWDGESDEGTASSEEPRVTATPAVGPDTAGLVLTGTF
jgi:hypothetical protein